MNIQIGANDIASKFENFDQFYSKLVDWIKKYKSAPPEVNKEDIQLGNMVRTVRKYYKMNKLSEEQIDKLNAIKEWYWSQDDLLNKNCNALIEFIAKNKKIPTQTGKTNEEREYGRLCKRIKEKYKQGVLPDNIKDKFNQIDKWCWGKTVFEDNLKKLTDYVDKHDALPRRQHGNDMILIN